MVGDDRIKSTELYDPKTERWRDVGDLPLSLSVSRATTINNTVLLFGTYIFLTFAASSSYVPTYSIAGGEWDDEDGYVWNTDSVLEFNKETETWSEVGHMKQKRGNQALSVVNFSDFEDWCQ